MRLKCAHKHRNWGGYRILVALVSLAIFGTSAVASASDDIYTCQIDGFNAPSSDGGSEYIEKLAVETVMVINRKTGNVNHPILGNMHMNVTLLDYSTSDWGFKLLSESQLNGGAPAGGRQTLYIEVAEFDDAIDKPLVIVAGGIAYWGTCR